MDPSPEPFNTLASLEAAAHAQATARYLLRLYVIGSTPNSVRAIRNIRKICEERLHGRYDLEVIDITESPTLAEGEQIIAAPTLVKELPPPLRRFIGDMSQTDRILLGLDLRAVTVSHDAGPATPPEPEPGPGPGR